MSTTPFLLAGRIVQSIVGLQTSIGPYLADFNETHVYNPKWPPHAKFHNGQTMSFGLTLGLLTQYFVFQPLLPTTSRLNFFPTLSPRESALIAGITGSLYWICGVSGILYPGTKWSDPEFGYGDGVGPQAYLFSANMVLAWVGYLLTVRGLSLKSKVA